MILPAMILAAALGGPGEVPPHCQHAVIMENSGNGPRYRAVICDALRDSDGEGWFLIVDGSPLQNGAVIIGSVRP